MHVIVCKVLIFDVYVVRCRKKRRETNTLVLRFWRMDGGLERRCSRWPEEEERDDHVGFSGISFLCLMMMLFLKTLEYLFLILSSSLSTLFI